MMSQPLGEGWGRCAAPAPVSALPAAPLPLSLLDTLPPLARSCLLSLVTHSRTNHSFPAGAFEPLRPPLHPVLLASPRKALPSLRGQGQT